MADLIRAYGWEATLLGGLEEWPDALLSPVNLMLSCQFPSLLLWGPEMVQLYNDAFIPLIGEKHPRALGQRAAECWEEAWHIFEPQLNGVLEHGESIFREDVLVPVMRHGKLHDVYWTYSYSPVYEGGGDVGGILVVCHDTTREYLAHHERIALADQLRQVLDATTDAVLSIDRNWRITYLNRPAGLAVARGRDLIGTDLWESFPLARYEGSPFEKHYRRAMEQGISGSFEAFYPEPLNIWVDVSVRPGANGIVLFFRDVTEQKKAAAARLESEERANFALQTAGFGVWTLNTRTGLAERTPLHDRIFGYEEMQPEWTFGKFLEHVPPEKHAEMESSFRESLEENRDWEIEAPITRADGEARWIWVKGRQFLDESGGKDKLIGLVADVTARRQEEERAARLYEERQRFYSLAETSRDFIGMCDLEGRLFYTNPEARALLGFDSLTETGATLRDFFFEGDQEFVLTEFLPRILREGHGEVEMRFRHFQTREPVWMSFQVVLLRNAEGEPNGYATVSRDLTAKKQQTAALMQTEKLAAVGRLAASIAHEINNPLESVTNLLYLANGSVELQEIKQYLEMAELELRRVSVISNQTLRFHKQSTHPTLVTCSELISSALSIYQARIINANIRVEKRRRSTQPVLCFEGEIRQVLSNLVGNAIDAMHADGGRLIFRSRTATDWESSTRGMVITLADTGPGIPSQVLAKIFDPFFTTKGDGGTGLGLWVSQEIVARHHGALRVRSSQRRQGHGTVFTLFLPFDAARPPVAVQ